MATLRTTGCSVESKSIRIFFSEKVDQAAPLGPGSANATEPSNYVIFAPNAGQVNAPFTGTPQVLPDSRSVLLSWPNPIFNAGDWVLVTVKNVGPSGGGTPIQSDEVHGRTPSDSARVTRDVEDAISYPLLTEEVAYRPSPVGISTSGAGGIVGPGGSNLGQVALQAVTDVLGWKANATDPKGFVGALTQAFTLTDVEGHVESKWVPRTYAVQTDLGGGISGAQASLYMRAKDALDQSLSLLDGLYPLDPEADPEYVKALREMARSQMSEIVKELGVVGLPSILRINTYFLILLGQDISSLHPAAIELNPDNVKGTLGELRDQYGIYFRGNRFNNSVEDEQDITNFRVICDYMTSLEQSWIANRDFFKVVPKDQAFFGTQLVLISRQFNVIAETVNEVRFALDSVFIGPNERQALLLKFKDPSLPPMFFEDAIKEVEYFFTQEGPRLLSDGGKISVTNNILPVVRSLERLIRGARDPEDPKSLPDGFKTARVRHSLDDLIAQLRDLAKLTEQVEQSLPPTEDKLAISSIEGPNRVQGTDTFKITVFGTEFDRNVKVVAHSTSPTAGKVDFITEERIDVTFPYSLRPGSHHLTLENPDGETATLENAFDWDPQKLTVTIQTKPALPPATVGSNYSQPLLASGGTPDYQWTVSIGSLPSGLNLDSTQQQISGIPNQGALGNSTFTITVTDKNGSTNTQSFTISVNPALSVPATTLPAGTVGSQYPKTTLQAIGGAAPFTWKVTAGSLPSGLNLTSQDGVISGVPNAVGGYSFTVTVTDTSGNSAVSPQLSISVADELFITTETLPGGAIGSEYSQTLDSEGGTPPFIWTVSSGNLPPGLSLSQSGSISGTPTFQGPYSFFVTVTDSNSNTADSQPLGITVGQRIIISPTVLPNAKVNQDYKQLLQATGGAGQYVWTLAPGDLGSGLTLTQDGNNGKILGKPSTPGTYNFTVKVTDTNGSAVTHDMTIEARDDWREHLEKMIEGLATITNENTLKLTDNTKRLNELIEMMEKSGRGKKGVAAA